MTSRLAAHLTTWKAWYAIFAVPAFMLASLVVIGGPLLTPVSFLLFAFLGLLFIALASRRWPSSADLALRRGLTRRDLLIIGVAWAVSHALFWALGRGAGSQTGRAEQLFSEMGLDGPLLPAAVGLLSAVVLAPVCEEILFRGTMLRPIHDAFARRGKTWWGVALGILASTVVFAMPHLAEDSLNRMTLAYLITGVSFGLVYVLTGSMTAAMIAHSLQSVTAFAQVLWFGHGDTTVHPVLWALVITSPVIVYLSAQLLRKILPQR
ncbi:CPBP family intramembrane glutamic endopeptidase [Corynebacterium nasicanis]|uniref:CPBP family intramembrane glutamic endopeptidase n=1 Tax=Corynebacterium nasicanis TaxID=1448267 RepID=A0ABW1QBS6_9CORY